MDRCFRAIAAWHRRADLQQRGDRQLIRASDPKAVKKAAQLIAAAPNLKLSESESKAVLDLYGIPTVRQISAPSLQAALSAAAQIGFPLALKVESPDIAHKSEAGAVALNLRSTDELGAAYRELLDRVRRHAPDARIHGVLLQPMIPAGVEVVIGARSDPLLGPLVMAGFGGVLVELLRDSVIELAPINAGEAMRMLRKLKGAALFDGFRGASAVNLDLLADLLVRVSEFAADQQELMSELDINPVICTASSLMAVDALIVRSAR
jgi:acyl-CoA synthetase (NDP forming)